MTTNNESGRRFEEQVGRWLQNLLRDYKPVVALNQSARGLDTRLPYQIDVTVRVTGGGVFGLFQQTHDLWVECKWKKEASIKRDEISRLVYKAQDVLRYARQAGDLYYDALMLVSNQRFDGDALHVAGRQGVSCVVFNGRRVIEDNTPENWITRPTWFARC